MGGGISTFRKGMGKKGRERYDDDGGKQIVCGSGWLTTLGWMDGVLYLSCMLDIILQLPAHVVRFSLR